MQSFVRIFYFSRALLCAWKKQFRSCINPADLRLTPYDISGTKIRQFLFLGASKLTLKKKPKSLDR